MTTQQTTQELVSMIACLLLAASAAYSQEPWEEALRKLVQNPVGQLTQVPIENDINFDAGPFARNSNTLEVEPVIPLRISRDWLLVSCILVNALVYQPNLAQAQGGVVGFGDATPTFFLTPAHATKVVWGLGPSLQMPTANQQRVGRGKMGVGAVGGGLCAAQVGDGGLYPSERLVRCRRSEASQHKPNDAPTFRPVQLGQDLVSQHVTNDRSGLDRLQPKPLDCASGRRCRKGLSDRETVVQCGSCILRRGRSSEGAAFAQMAVEPATGPSIPEEKS